MVRNRRSFWAGACIQYDAATRTANPAGLCGPIITLSSEAAQSTTDLAFALSEATVGFRRGNCFGLGVSAVHPVASEDLNIVQRPPVYRDRLTLYSAPDAPDQPQTVTTVFSNSTTYWQTVGAVWDSGIGTLGPNNNLFATLPTTFQMAQLAGLDALRILAAVGGIDGLDRLTFPGLFPLLELPELAGGGAAVFHIDDPGKGFIGGAYLGIDDQNSLPSPLYESVPWVAPADGFLTALTVEGLNTSSSLTATVATVALCKSVGGNRRSYSKTPLTAQIGGTGRGASPSGVYVSVSRGDLLLLTCDVNWETYGASMSALFYPITLESIGG